MEVPFEVPQVKDRQGFILTRVCGSWGGGGRVWAYASGDVVDGSARGACELSPDEVRVGLFRQFR